MSKGIRAHIFVSQIKHFTKFTPILLLISWLQQKRSLLLFFIQLCFSTNILKYLSTDEAKNIFQQVYKSFKISNNHQKRTSSSATTSLLRSLSSKYARGCIISIFRLFSKHSVFSDIFHKNFDLYMNLDLKAPTGSQMNHTSSLLARFYTRLIRTVAEANRCRQRTRQKKQKLLFY